MFDIVTTLIIQTIDVIVKAKYRTTPGAKKLYTLYILLDDLIICSEHVEHDLKLRVERNMDVDWGYLVHDINELSSLVTQLRRRLIALSVGKIGIFDSKTSRLLVAIVGDKAQFIGLVASGIAKLDVKAPRNLRKIHDYKIPDELRIDSIYPGPDGDATDYLEQETFDFNDKQAMEALLSRGMRNIELLRQSKQALGNFIRRNYKLADLF